ncbi:MAG TPA: cytochrome B, partial [Thermopetrobacter sp.]|nr:cytochrome B [Thermopetrobacter sp.]
MTLSAHTGHDAPRTIRVWDPSIRLFHWALAGLVVICLMTGFFGGPSLFVVHITAGGGVAALLAYRLVWGFIGPRHARFRDFAHGPKALVAHLRGLLAGRPARHAGHNPAGAWMIFALLGVLTLIVASGLVALGGTEKMGPLAGAAPYAAGKAARGLHEALALLVLLMVAGHIGGVVVESWLLGENLPASMVHGRRVTMGAEGLRETPPWRLAARLPLAIIAAAGVFALVSGLPLIGVVKSVASTENPQRWPAAYASECGDCHTPYHPALLPPAGWRAILDGLEDHFGEDASLEPDTLAAIRGWLLKEAAKRWDIKPAHEMRPANGRPLPRMTET